MEFFVWIKGIDKVVGDSLHFFFCDLGGADVHVPVNLHGICRNHRPAYLLCQADGKLRFPYGSRPR